MTKSIDLLTDCGYIRHASGRRKGNVSKSALTDPQFVDAEAVEAALAACRTLPTHWYSDPEVFAYELANLFGRRWHVAGPVERVSQPGDHIVAQAGNVPVVVVRGQDGELRGFVNVCRHRGYKVACEDGSRSFLQCQYHGWTYNLDGSLRRTPSCAPGEFDGLGLELLPVAVDEWNRFVFVNADPDAGPLLGAFPELPEVAADLQVDPTGYTYEGVTAVEIQGNWKGWCENSVECYHCPTIHKTSFDTRLQASVSGADGAREVTTENVIGAISVPRPEYRVAGDDDGGRVPGLRYFFLFPGSFIIQDDYVCIAGYTVPVAPDLTRFVVHTYTRDGMDPAAIEDWQKMWDQTFAEDAEVVRLQQAGYASGRLEYGQLSGVADQMILKFHELTWRSYRKLLAL